MSRVLSRILDVACLLLLTSVVMDSVLWIVQRFMIPCWTMAAVSAGAIALL